MEVPTPMEEPASKRYRCSVENSGRNDAGGDDRNVYYCMNVVIQSRPFEMNQEIIEGIIQLM